MFVEVHILQNFAPSNLNRDDTNAPKDCQFGGYRRARISSQAIKRAVREQFRKERLLAPEELSVRTKRLVDEVSSRLVALGRDPEQARAVALAAINGLPAKTEQDHKTQYLLFLGEREIGNLAEVCQKNWDALVKVAPAKDGPTDAKSFKKASRDAVADLHDQLVSTLDGGKAADLALFGRMIADLPDRNVDAASQVAHAISTHQVNMEFDFYTAVDDLRPEDTAGADMMGTVEFNSACFYRYANVDVEQLVKNLSGDTELAKRTVEAFLKGLVHAMPTGKQHSMAAQNPPSLVYVVIRSDGRWPWSLANAFVRPVQPSGNVDLIERSVLKLDAYRAKLREAYACQDIVTEAAVVVTDDGGKAFEDCRVATLAELVQRAVGAAFPEKV